MHIYGHVALNRFGEKLIAPHARASQDYPRKDGLPVKMIRSSSDARGGGYVEWCAADEGWSFAFVSGLGEASIRTPLVSGYWWTCLYTSDQGANYGALFGVFNYQGNSRHAQLYFKDINETIVDDFYVQSSVGSHASRPMTSADPASGASSRYSFILTPAGPK